MTLWFHALVDIIVHWRYLVWRYGFTLWSVSTQPVFGVALLFHVVIYIYTGCGFYGAVVSRCDLY